MIADLPHPPHHVTLVFDGDCGFCTLAARLARRLDRRHRLTLLPCQRAGAVTALGVSAADCARTAWAITPDGRRYAGAAAINVALTTILGTRLPWRIYRLPGPRRVQDGLYAWVARHRGRFPGTTPYCVQHPDECV